PLPEAALAAPAWAALRAGDQDRTAPAPGTRDAPGGVRHARACQRRVGSLRLADPDRVCGTPQPHHPPARGGRWAAREHPLQGRGRGPPPAGLVQRVLEFLLASRLLAPGAPAVGADQGDGLGHTVAALYASHGGGTDGSGVDLARGVAVSGATVAAASRGVSKLWWWEAAR